MTNDRFREEYRCSVDSLALPVGYKEKILSALSEANSKAEDKSTEGIKGKVTPFDVHSRNQASKNTLRFVCGLVAAVLVIAVALGAMFSVGNILPSAKEIRFRVSCATNLKQIAGARVVFIGKSGQTLRNKEGSVIEAYSDENGQVTATIPDTEECTVQISMDGYITATEDISKENIYLSPVMDDNTYRAVLQWSEDLDLDAHLVYESQRGTEKLDYFNSDIENDEGQVIATLDTDSDKSGFPETITFNACDGELFRFSVASYSGLKDGQHKDIRYSGAKVTLYRGNECIGVYNGDEEAQGNVWCVFEVENNDLRVCDYTYTVSNLKEIR